MVVMSRLVLCISLAAITLAVGVPSIARAQPQQPPRKFLGIPRDIDFIKNQGWAQVIVQGRDPDPLISETKNDRIQSSLLLALMLKREVVVDHVEDENRPKKLTSASLSVNTKQEQGQVLMLSFDEKDNYCRAVIFYDGKTNNVWTTSAQMQGVLETAVRESIPVQQFMFDGKTMEITRGKVNVELPRK